MRNTFMGFCFVVLAFLAAGAAFAQEGNTAGASRYEYAMIALDEPALAGPSWVRIYYGNGKVEDFGKESSTWSGRQGDIRDLDLTVSAINYLAEKGYELFRILENDRSADSSIRHRYLLRRRK
jgi:hypothetical protein